MTSTPASQSTQRPPPVSTFLPPASFPTSHPFVPLATAAIPSLGPSVITAPAIRPPPTTPTPPSIPTAQEQNDGNMAGTKPGSRKSRGGGKGNRGGRKNNSLRAAAPSAARGRDVGNSARASVSTPTTAYNAPVTPDSVSHEDNDRAQQSGDQGERPKKKTRMRNMNKQEKLILIRECCKHADEYRALNKTKFWAIISNLLKQQTGYNLVSPGQTVTRWVKAQINELVEVEMGSGTEMERDYFKTAVEQFADRMKIVSQESKRLAQGITGRASQAIRSRAESRGTALQFT